MSPRCLVDRSCLGTSTSSNLISKQREWLLKILLYPKMLIPCQTAAGSLISSFYDATSRVDPKPIAIFHFKQLPTYQLLISPGVILPGSSWGGSSLVILGPVPGLGPKAWHHWWWLMDFSERRTHWLIDWCIYPFKKYYRVGVFNMYYRLTDWRTEALLEVLSDLKS